MGDRDWFADDEPAFTLLAKRMPLRYVRLNAAYNLLSDYNASTKRCQQSGPYTHGGDDGHGFRTPADGWNILRSELQVARAEGLTPLITITDGIEISKPANGRDPKWPIPVYWDGHHYRQTVAGQTFKCGVTALIKAVQHEQRAGHGHTADWETFNEPDARKSYNGTLKGACNSSNSQCRARYTKLCAPVVKNQCGPLRGRQPLRRAEPRRRSRSRRRKGRRTGCDSPRHLRQRLSV